AARRGLQWRMARTQEELSALGEADGAAGTRAQAADERAPAAGEDRIAALEVELAEIEQRQRGELEGELRGLHEAGEREAARVRELDGELAQARQQRARADALVQKAREGDVWSVTWQEVRRVIADGIERALAAPDEH